jgi:hypothetical protein
MPYSNGLTRNVVQCLEDYNIPLYPVAHHHQSAWKCAGYRRDDCQVDENRMPIAGTEFDIDCDTLCSRSG